MLLVVAKGGYDVVGGDAGEAAVLLSLVLVGFLVFVWVAIGGVVDS